MRKTKQAGSEDSINRSVKARFENYAKMLGSWQELNRKNKEKKTGHIPQV
jgi:hypothetical protein